MSDVTIEYFEKLFQEQYPIVFRQLMQLVGERSVVEDLVQETFLRLYKQPPGDLSKVGPWLHRTSTRLAYDYLNKKSKQRRLEERIQKSSAQLQVVHPSSEYEVLQTLDAERVQRALGRLSDRDRKALLLKHEGYSYHDIADKLNVKDNVVGTILLRAMNRLRRSFEKEATRHGREGSL